MILQKIYKQIKCDTVMCHKNSSYQITTNSYKGDMFLCTDCFTNLQKVLKRTTTKNEQK